MTALMSSCSFQVRLLRFVGSSQKSSILVDHGDVTRQPFEVRAEGGNRIQGTRDAVRRAPVCA